MGSVFLDCGSGSIPTAANGSNGKSADDEDDVPDSVRDSGRLGEGEDRDFARDDITTGDGASTVIAEDVTTVVGADSAVAEDDNVMVFDTSVGAGSKCSETAGEAGLRGVGEETAGSEGCRSLCDGELPIGCGELLRERLDRTDFWILGEDRRGEMSCQWKEPSAEGKVDTGELNRLCEPVGDRL